MSARRQCATGVALVYHRVEARAGNPDRELLPALAVGSFSRQIDWLQRRFTLVRASALYDAAAERGPRDPVPLALTFDDDLRSHSEIVLPELARRGAPATFFLGGTALDDDQPPPWWESLEAAARRSPKEALKGLSLTEAAAAIEALTAIERAKEGERLARLAGAGATREPLDSDGIRRLSEAGMEIGFHTRGHHRLPSLADAKLTAELTGGRDALERLTGTRLTSIAYPHGVADARVAGAARRVGYDRGFTTAGTALGPGTDPMTIPRIYPVRRRLRLRLKLTRALSGL
jgi:peptidoglycan/xylan/chitin deacetylase (PgdA/CDA1 family)